MSSTQGEMTMVNPTQPDDLETFTARIEKILADQFRDFRLTQARTLRESAKLAEGSRKATLLRMAEEWEESPTAV
jgi:hypothetical protein